MTTIGMLATWALLVSPLSQLEQGWKAYRESRLEEAERCWREALREDPYAARAEQGLERLKLERLNMSDSEPFAGAVREGYESGMRAYRKSHWVEAEEAFARAQALAPHLAVLGERLKEVREKILKAVPASDPLVETPTKPVEASQPGLTLTFGSAPKTPVRPIVRPAPPPSDPDQIERVYQAGLRAYRRKQFQEALQQWRRVLGLDPGHEKALKNIRALERELVPDREKRGENPAKSE